MLSLIKNNSEEDRDLLFLAPKEYGKETTESIINFASKNPDITRVFLELDEGREVTITLEDGLNEVDYIFLNYKDSEQTAPSVPQQTSYKLIIKAFESTYFLNTQIVGLKEFPEDEFDVVISPPSSVRVIKDRSQGRITTNFAKKQCFQAGERQKEYEVYDIGPNSISVKASRDEQLSALILGGAAYPIELVRFNESKGVKVYKICSEDHRELFLNYLAHQAPDLKERRAFRISDMTEAQQRTNYFNNFEISAERVQHKINDDFSHLDKTADYQNMDICLVKEGKITGGSSSMRAFKHQDKEHWLLHQLFSDKERNTLDETGQLYSWRVQYAQLSLAPAGELIGWFRSKSRWLERIYVKYILKTNSENCLRQVKLLKLKVQASSQPLKDAHFLEVSGCKRVNYSDERVDLSVGERLFNASGLSNYVIVKENGAGLDELIALAQDALHSLNKQEEHIYFSLPQDFQVPEKYLNKTMPSDRFFTIPNQRLDDFISSIKYSIEITKKKKHEDVS